MAIEDIDIKPRDRGVIIPGVLGAACQILVDWLRGIGVFGDRSEAITFNIGHESVTVFNYDFIAVLLVLLVPVLAFRVWEKFVPTHDWDHAVDVVRQIGSNTEIDAIESAIDSADKISQQCERIKIFILAYALGFAYVNIGGALCSNKQNLDFASPIIEVLTVTMLAIILIGYLGCSHLMGEFAKKSAESSLGAIKGLMLRRP